jgi:hypothetical protein
MCGLLSFVLRVYGREEPKKMSSQDWSPLASAFRNAALKVVEAWHSPPQYVFWDDAEAACIRDCKVLAREWGPRFWSTLPSDEEFRNYRIAVGDHRGTRFLRNQILPIKIKESVLPFVVSGEMSAQHDLPIQEPMLDTLCDFLNLHNDLARVMQPKPKIRADCRPTKPRSTA